MDTVSIHYLNLAEEHIFYVLRPDKIYSTTLTTFVYMYADFILFFLWWSITTFNIVNFWTILPNFVELFNAWASVYCVVFQKEFYKIDRII